MLEERRFCWFLILLWVSTVSGQFDSRCPANSAMGLCVEVPKQCFSDSDCYNGEICCPEACSRTCKSRYSMSQHGDGSVPDLLNDPRVYVGKCPDASCFSMFGGDPDECSTSKLCPQEQFCCNDGCKNVCHWKPQYAALIAQEQARVRHRQQIIIQKQQEVMKRKQQEMYTQRQRQLATVEQAKRQAEARAAAEAELAAQKARAKYEDDLKAAAEARVKSNQRQQQLMLQQQSPSQSALSAPSSQTVPSTKSFLDNFNQELPSSNIHSNNVVQQQPVVQSSQRDSQISGRVSSNKKDNFPSSLMNQINSPANLNPYSLLSQQNVQSKLTQDPQSTYPAQQIINSNQPQNIYQSSANLQQSSSVSLQNAPSTHQVRQLPTSYQQGYSPYTAHKPLTVYPGQQALSAFPVQNQSPAYTSHNSLPSYGGQTHRSQAVPVNPYRSSNQYSSPTQYRQHRRQDSMAPYLMYQFLQTAA